MTFCTHHRANWFSERAFTDIAIAQMLQSSASNAFAVYAYCFMPDHLHLLVEGRRESSALKKYAKDVKQRVSYHDPQRGSRDVWQPGLYERILRENEPPIIVAKYILENPVRADLVKEPRDYPYSGSTEWTWEQMIEMWQTNVERYGTT